MHEGHQHKTWSIRVLCCQHDSVSCLLKRKLSLPQKEKAQKKMGFLTEVEEDTNSLRDLKAAHAETIQELQKTRKILNMESNICKDYKVESFNRMSTHCSVYMFPAATVI